MLFLRNLYCDSSSSMCTLGFECIYIYIYSIARYNIVSPLNHFIKRLSKAKEIQV